MQRYENYHKHSHYSNITTLDVIVKPEDYMKRAKELGQRIYFTTEHGYNGNIYEALTLAEKYDLKVVSGMEAYYVPNRKEKDKIQDKKSKNYGEEVFRDRGYYVTLEGVLNGYLKAQTREFVQNNEADIKELIKEIKKQTEFVKKLNLKV